MVRDVPPARSPVIAALGVVVGAAALGYVLGYRAHQAVTTRAGVAYATPVQASVAVGRWRYNIPLDVPWID
jgi:hypothetical protein